MRIQDINIDKDFQKLYEAALSVVNPRQIAPRVTAGSVGAAVLTKDGNIYTGVCINTSCSLGICAERNALGTMITNGEIEVLKVCSVYKDGKVMPPCSACREFMMQLGPFAQDIEILLDNDGKFVKLSELLPESCF